MSVVTFRLVFSLGLFAMLLGCNSPYERTAPDDFPNLAAHARPMVMRDLRKDGKPSSEWQHLIEEQRKRDRQRLEQQPKVSAAFVELPIRDALFEISNQSKIPVVVDQSVTGNVTLNLPEVPFETALRLIVFAGGYAYSTDGESFFVGSLDPNSPNYTRLTSTRVLHTSLAPKELVNGLNKAYAPFISFSEGMNQIILTGPTSVLDRLEADVRLLDRPAVQILIEVLVVETRTGSDLALGLDFGRLEATLEKRFQFQDGTRTIDQLDIIGRVALAFDYLATKDMARIRSHPKVVTTDGTPAEIRSLVESYVLITRPGVVVSSDIQIIRSGTTLKVTPRITRDDEIELTIEPEVADVVGVTGQNGAALPVINRRYARSVVRVRNGDVIILGGLYEEQLRDIRKGIPFLKDVPILQYAFGRTDSAARETELLIFVSPKVLK